MTRIRNLVFRMRARKAYADTPVYADLARDFPNVHRMLHEPIEVPW